MFQLIQPTTVKLLHISMHTVKRGKKEFRDAYSLDFEMSGNNARVLGLLDGALCPAVYHDPDDDNGQETAPGIDPVLPALRFPRLRELPWEDEQTGMDLTVVYGLGDEQSNVQLDDGKASTKKVLLKHDGVSTLLFRFWTESMPDGALDKLRGKQQQEVSITLVRPEKLREDAVIDGTVGHPGAAAAAEAAAAGQGDLLDADETPEQALARAAAGGAETDPDASETRADADDAAGTEEQPADPERGTNWPFGTNSGADGTNEAAGETAGASGETDAAEFEAGAAAAIAKAKPARRQRRAGAAVQ